jgi:hypothetical protein
LQKVFAVEQFGYFVCSQWDGAGTWFQELIDQCVHTYPEAMVGIAFGLPRSQFWHYDQA